jgi:hypothetical protein
MTHAQGNPRTAPKVRARDLAHLVTKLAAPATSSLAAPYIGIPWALAEIAGWWIGLTKKSEDSAEPSMRVVAEQVSAVVREPSAAGVFPQAGTDDPVAAVRERAGRLVRANEVASEEIGQLRAVLELQVARRAAEIARSPAAGSDFDNWVQARRELKIADEAARVAAADPASPDFDNWLKAERQTYIAELAEHWDRVRGGGDFDNWITAERQFDLVRQAREVLTDRENRHRIDFWLPMSCVPEAGERAAALQAVFPRELTVGNYVDVLVHVAVRRFARALARRDPGRADFDNWQRAERDVHVEFAETLRRVRDERIRDRAAHRSGVSAGGSDMENWLGAETEVLIEEKCVETMNWGSAEAAVRASRLSVHRRIADHRQRVVERAREIALSAEAGTDQENWLRAERELQGSWLLPRLPPA